jgi:hypothetical protein
MGIEGEVTSRYLQRERESIQQAEEGERKGDEHEEEASRLRRMDALKTPSRRRQELIRRLLATAGSNRDVVHSFRTEEKSPARGQTIGEVGWSGV